ncbi:tRNA-i(6)A37 thiotransferase enzyme MiaB [Neorickettsia helminthoeca str. Oregon]|uniref:tRNA-2-methylthio-N(6)-dimethylallyladenosine synthase n=1 Tax=Neorickettsia helminthoeca str. Oregon TaxID=1286528 RepID=X5GXE0_9RICK|nr:tRNA (N6-isopentenyl adenosine(37)-C2)-methylthiotransferase MiaB [Neorickettsia helminthoeca]AHX11722.1 tRNA-i(6)A37 thiotransferase enzyme MiaB [Neorickettsia helminthoeca str. Oregon]
MEIPEFKSTKNLYIKTYGCQMNVYDSEMIEKIVGQMGFRTVETAEDADLVILNTCHIREKAAEKIYSELGKLRALEKRKQKKIMTVVAGCVAQAEGDEIIKRARNVDIVVGPQSLHTLPELIARVERKSSKEVRLEFHPIEKFDYLSGEITKDEACQYSAFLSIQEGCDKFCSFCVVPYTRGSEYSRTVEAVYREALALTANGVKEITLLGQNVNGYHGSLDAGEYTMNLGQLISRIANIPSLLRIRYTTSHPVDMHDELYEAHAKESKLMPFIHLPVQSGSDRVLKRMNRKYTASTYLEIVQRLKKARDDIAFSSDFIVGFPGESDDDFQQTLELVKQVEYAQCYSFKYSPRPGTPGAGYPQIDEKIKDMRLQKLQALLREKQLLFNQKMIGKTVKVLFDKKNTDQISGRTEYMQPVYSDDASLFGKMVTMEVKDASAFTLKCIPVGII